MAKLSELFKFKTFITIEKHGKKQKVWVRIVGDDDLQDAYRTARIASHDIRIKLRDKDSKEYKDQVLPISEADEFQCKELIKAARSNNFTSEALANIERPELPELEEVAVDADAASLEEQEKFDILLEKTTTDYTKAIQDYVKDRVEALDSELDGMSLDELRVAAMESTSDVIALGVFIQRLQDEKAWRSVYMDEKCTESGFDSFEDFNSSDLVVKQSIREAYGKLETDPEDVKK